MNDLDRKLLAEFLRSRHLVLILGILLLFGAGGFPLFIGILTRTDLQTLVHVAFQWFGGEYSDFPTFTRLQLLLILSVQVGAILAACGVGALLFYAYRELKFRAVIRALEQRANRPVSTDETR